MKDASLDVLEKNLKESQKTLAKMEVSFFITLLFDLLLLLAYLKLNPISMNT